MTAATRGAPGWARALEQQAETSFWILAVVDGAHELIRSPWCRTGKQFMPVAIKFGKERDTGSPRSGERIVCC